MADIPIQESDDDALVTFQPASAAGDSFENDGNVQIWASGPPTGFSLVFSNARDCNYKGHADFSKTAEAGNTQMVTGRFSPFRFSQSNGTVSISYLPSAVGIQVAALRSVVQLTD